MYLPTEFGETDEGRLWQWIRQWPFATLVSAAAADDVTVTHLPLIIDVSAGSPGVILGHMARANTHHLSFDGNRPATAIFHGPHAYVSPTWYAPGPSLPTWIYAAVHVHGRPRIIEDLAASRQRLDALIAHFESSWHLGLVPSSYLDGKMNGIVTFDIPIERIVGKAKLGQRQSPEDRQRVKDALLQTSDTARHDVAAMVDATAPARTRTTG